MPQLKLSLCQCLRKGPFAPTSAGRFFGVLCVPLFPEELAMFLNGSCVTTGLKYQLQQLVTSHSFCDVVVFACIIAPCPAAQQESSYVFIAGGSFFYLPSLPFANGNVLVESLADME